MLDRDGTGPVEKMECTTQGRYSLRLKPCRLAWRHWNMRLVGIFSAVSWRLSCSALKSSNPTSQLGLHILFLASPSDISCCQGTPGPPLHVLQPAASRQRRSGTVSQNSDASSKKVWVWTNWFLLFHSAPILLYICPFPENIKSCVLWEGFDTLLK